MKIHLADLKKGLNSWQDSVSPDDLNLDSSVHRQDVTVDLTVDKRVGKVAVTISTHSVGDFVCDRCGEDFQQELGSNCSILFIQRERALPDELPGDDLRSYMAGQDELDITTDIRDALLLSVPMKLLCSEDCLGLCPNCGANLNKEQCRCRSHDQRKK